MQNVKKILCGLSVVAAAVLLQGNVASAEEEPSTLPTTAITMDYEKQLMKISEVGMAKRDTSINFGFASVKKGVVKVSNWSVYKYDEGLTVDLSYLNNQKDNYIQIKGNVNKDPITLLIPSANKKVGVQMNPVNAQVAFCTYTTSMKKDAEEIEDGLVQYRTKYSNWNTYINGTTDLSIYQPLGATLYFREGADETSTIQEFTDDAYDILKDANGNEVPLYTLGSFPGKEVKVTIKKLANSPKVKVDYVKNTCTIPANCEYRATAPGDYAAEFGDPLSMKLTKSLANLLPRGEGWLEIRTAATEKKPFSLINQIYYKLENPKIVNIDNDRITDSTVLAGKDAADNYVEDEEDGRVVSVYEYTKDKSGSYTGLTLTNESTKYAYQVIVLSSASTKPRADVAGLKTLNKAKSSSKPGQLKLTGLSTGQKVYIRRMGDAKKQIWSTDFACLGTVKFPTN